ncbi:uncharacterized protein LOC108108562 [Drosophila eugracilis]|uniref:uncharacterized protein LOC108108562 n=1 Tax=Drosophila eugracilis TaxID=29029 RepID=UPI0007E81788|nr:uncharacterized protein LOC108108562 [Drosophila eugracilis]
MPRTPCEPQQDPLHQTTLNGSRQNESSVMQQMLSRNKDDEYQCCNSPECPNNSSPIRSSNNQTFPQQIVPLHNLFNFQSAINHLHQSPRHTTRSHSVPRHHYRNNEYDKFDHHKSTHNEHRNAIKPRNDHTPCEKNMPSGNSYSINQCDNYDMDCSSRNNTSNGWNNSSQIGMNFGEFQRRQLQSQQQQARPQNQSRISWIDDEESIDFNPDLNSTRISRGDSYQQSVKNYSQQSPRYREKPSCQMCNTSCQPQSKEQSMSAPSPELMRRQKQCESPQLRCRQMDYETEINNTSYLQPPETLRNARCTPQTIQNLGKNQCCNNSLNINRDLPKNRSTCCQKSLGQSQNNRSIPPISQAGCCSQGSTAFDRSLQDNRRFECRGNTSTLRNQTQMDMSQIMSEWSYTNHTSLGKSKQNSSFGGRSMQTPEDRLAERIQNDFHETLVKDRFCPGIIQASLDGRENFNQYAQEIAFAGPIPEKPFPVDPITMIEAIKLRIDYERKEIRKEKDKAEERDKDTKNHSKDAKSRRSRPTIVNDIDVHFNSKNKSEVNEGVAAFLKAENDYHNTSMGTDSAFDAHINSFDSNLFDEQVKVNSYTATTTPIYR